MALSLFTGATAFGRYLLKAGGSLQRKIWYLPWHLGALSFTAQFYCRWRRVFWWSASSSECLFPHIVKRLHCTYRLWMKDGRKTKGCERVLKVSKYAMACYKAIRVFHSLEKTTWTCRWLSHIKNYRKLLTHSLEARCAAVAKQTWIIAMGNSRLLWKCRKPL